MLVAEGDAARHAAEVLLERDARLQDGSEEGSGKLGQSRGEGGSAARVRVACLREVEDGALRQQLLDVRVARAEEARLEVSDTRLRDESRRGGDLGGGGGGL